jgi:NAD-dependent deacetylase
MREIVTLIKKGQVVAFCGAGLSVESGIPACRGTGGLWEKYNPELYATIEGLTSLFIFQPHKLRDFIIDCYGVFLKAEPNHGHFALKDLEEKGYLSGIITQNIDDFHFQAGSKKVSEVHGNAYKFRCSKCGFFLKKKKEEVEDLLKDLQAAKKRKQILKNILHFMGRCPRCNQRLESGIVFFGQSLPQEEIEKSYHFLDRAKTVLCVGASGEVYPAASFPLYAKERGAKVININPQESSFDAISDFVSRKTAVDFFKNLLLSF